LFGRGRSIRLEVKSAMVDDVELLRRYLGGSETAFTEFVRRHVNLVYAAALRRVGNDRSLAEEVTQSVFTQCARKAAALQAHPTLSGWLHRSTRFAAIDAVRAKQRRIAAEGSDFMNEDLSPSPNQTWIELRPMVDALLDRLAARDRDALVLRFFEGESFAEIGTKLRLTEDAARMRVDRALEKLRAKMARRGLRSTASALGVVLTQHGAFAAPAGLAATVSASALAVTPAVSAGTIATVFLMHKVHAGIIAAVAGFGIMAVIGESRANLDLRRQIAAWPARETPALPAVTTTQHQRDRTAELARLHARIVELKSRPDGVVDSQILKVAQLRNVGRATPQAAFETFAWAALNQQLDVVAESYQFGDTTKHEADAYFAQLAPELQAKYGSPERLFASYVISGPPKLRMDAMQVIDLIPGERPDEADVRVWFHFADGTSQVGSQPFRRVGDQWVFGHRKMGLSLDLAVKALRQSSEPSLPEFSPNAP
jgi:RNA polymerase sigma factor (sigma-70 family)